VLEGKKGKKQGKCHWRWYKKGVLREKVTKKNGLSDDGGISGVVIRKEEKRNIDLEQEGVRCFEPQRGNPLPQARRDFKKTWVTCTKTGRFVQRTIEKANQRRKQCEGGRPNQRRYSGSVSLGKPKGDGFKQMQFLRARGRK